MAFIFGWSAKNHNVGMYHMIKLHTNLIVIICDFLWLKNTYAKYIAIFQHTKGGYYILQEKGKANKCSYLKFDIVTAGNVTNDQYHRR